MKVGLFTQILLEQPDGFFFIKDVWKHVPSPNGKQVSRLISFAFPRNGLLAVLLAMWKVSLRVCETAAHDQVPSECDQWGQEARTPYAKFASKNQGTEIFQP